MTFPTKLLAAVVLATAVALPNPVQAKEPAKERMSADAKLAEALARFGNADFEGALRLLDAAEAEAEDGALRALIQKQVALVHLALGRRIEGTMAFTRALRSDPALSFETQMHGEAVQQAFDCARALASTSMGLTEIREKVTKSRSEPGGGRCPVVAAPAAPPKSPAPTVSAPPPATEPATEVAARAPQGVPFWPVWVSGGVAVAAAGAGTYFGLAALGHARDRDQASDPGAWEDADAQARDSAGAATITFGVAGAAVATAVGLTLWYFLDQSDEAPVALLAVDPIAGTFAAAVSF